MWFASWWYELSNFFVVSISTSTTPSFSIKGVEFCNGLLRGIYKYPCFVLVLLLESICVHNNEQMVEIPWNFKRKLCLSHWECSLSYVPFILLSIFKSNHGSKCQQTEFKRITSPLKYQTRCVAAFPDQQGFLVCNCL